MPVAGTPPLGSGNVQKVKTRLEKRTKKLNLPCMYYKNSNDKFEALLNYFI